MVADIARELGRRAGIVTITPLPTAAAVLEAVRTGAADIGFVAPGQAHWGRAVFPDLHAGQQSALVRTDSPLRSVRRIWTGPAKSSASTPITAWAYGCRAANRRPPARHLTTLRDAVQWLQDGTVVAFAGGHRD